MKSVFSTSRTYMKCPVCEKKISVEKSWLNRFCMDDVLYLKMHSHIKKKHNKEYLTLKGIVLSSFSILFGFFLSIILAVIWILTFIPWAIHEACE